MAKPVTAAEPSDGGAEPTPDETATPARREPGAIVALGASAGGLDALDRFFGSLSEDADAAFVVIQHLAPEHETMMDKLLGRHTGMTVTVARHDVPLEAGRVYVIPPAAAMTLQDGRLQLGPRKSGGGISLPIDQFFKSLAETYADRAIGIVLSGTGSDGSEGLRVLAAAGGWAMAQEPETCRFDGMPRSAIATGAVDHVLPPEALAHEVDLLIRSGSRPPARSDRSPETPEVLDEHALVGGRMRRISLLLRLNLTEYKPTTLLRRIERRMHACETRDFADYMERLEEDGDERARLRHEILIPVTGFFRDAQAFAALRDKVIVPLVEGRKENPDKPIRVWITACSTGEEAYSIAMLLLDELDAQGCTVDTKIFATDVDGAYVARAASGRYSDAAVEDMPADLRERWFTSSSDERSVTVAHRLRQAVVFSIHDLLTDAPLTNMDLISCRNMLIYLRVSAQDRVLSRLAYALRAGGVLYLGSSETMGKLSGEFTPIDARLKLFKLKRRIPTLPPEDVLPGPHLSQGMRGSHWTAMETVRRARPVVDDALTRLTELYAPPAVLVDSARSVLHVFGDTRDFVGLRAGSPSLDLLHLLDPALAPVVSTLIHTAMREKTPQRSRVAMKWPDGSLRRHVAAVVTPLDPQEVSVSHLIVAFETDAIPVEGSPARDIGSERIADLSNMRAADLERELDLTRQNLSSTIQELGTANEELQASNEELMASNEELQSANEELQSVNEELHTVNAEFQAKIGELNEANADLDSLMQATRIPLLFLDADLQITRFTPELVRLFQIRQSDLTRPITDLTHVFDFPEFPDRIRSALRNVRPEQVEVHDRSGRPWMIAIQPYTASGSDALRIVVSFVDLSDVMDLERLQSVIDALPESVAVLDARGTLVQVNRSWEEFADRNGGAERGTGVGTNYLEVCRKAAASDGFARKVLDGLDAVIERRQPSFTLVYPCHSPTQERWFLLNAAGLTAGGCVITHFNLSNWIDPQKVSALTLEGPPSQPE